MFFYKIWGQCNTLMVMATFSLFMIGKTVLDLNIFFFPFPLRLHYSQFKKTDYMNSIMYVNNYYKLRLEIWKKKKL